uniref:Uncharacterized protein n=1 Tax=Nothoprocta perdicaria TaxID=30464 RepID=A0A8C7EA73_NOTPE
MTVQAEGEDSFIIQKRGKTDLELSNSLHPVNPFRTQGVFCPRLSSINRKQTLTTGMRRKKNGKRCKAMTKAEETTGCYE